MEVEVNNRLVSKPIIMSHGATDSHSSRRGKRVIMSCADSVDPYQPEEHSYSDQAPYCSHIKSTLSHMIEDSVASNHTARIRMLIWSKAVRIRPNEHFRLTAVN